MIPAQPGPPAIERTRDASRPAPGSHRARRTSRRDRSWVLAAAAGLTAVVVIAGCEYPYQLLLVVLTGAGIFNMAVGSLEARWRLHAWRTPEAADRYRWPPPVSRAEASLTFSLILAARDEAPVIADTLRGLARQDHPGTEVVVSLCADDISTIASVRAVAAEFPDLIKVVTSHYAKPSKARQLNTALTRCSGRVVGVIDAEDDVAATLLRHVEALFRVSGAHIVQGGVQLMNLGDSPAKWFQVHNVLEYYFWYTSRMAYQADIGFVPLGGNTVFIYRELLERSGGWPLSLTEDCALGVRLSANFNVKVATAYSADLCTREEAPPTLFNKELGSLFWQRDRWVRGFVAELMRGTWRSMPGFRQRVFAAYILATPLLQGLASLLLPLAVVTALTTKAPIGLALALFTPLVPMGISVLTQLMGLRQFSREFRQRVTVWHYASVLCLAPLYQVLLMAAAATAVYKYVAGDTHWYKTGRASQHRGAQAALMQPGVALAPEPGR